MRHAVRELLDVAGLWFGLGEPARGQPVRRGAAFLTVQTLAAISLAALVAAVVSALRQPGLAAGSLPAAYVILAIPLAVAVASRPAGSVLPLAAALPAGAVAGVVTHLLLAAWGDGFWPAFGAASAGVLVAGAVFGALREPSR
jgi:FtsH-binding integral membrane protein